MSRPWTFYAKVGARIGVLMSAPLIGVTWYEDKRSKDRYPLLDAKALRSGVVPERVLLGPKSETLNLVDVWRYEVPVAWVQRRAGTSPEQIFARCYWRSMPIMLERMGMNLLELFG